MAVGALIAGLCGLCTLVVLVSYGADQGGLALVVGGLPTALGVGLFFLGRMIYRGFRD